MRGPTTEAKLKTVLTKNTYYYFDPEFSERYEGHLHSLRETLLGLENDVRRQGLCKEMLVRLLQDKELGLDALLALTGFSMESLKRLTTVVRLVDDEEFATLMNRSTWCPAERAEDVKEWSTGRVRDLVRSHDGFRAGVVNLFFEGASIAFLSKTLPLYELKKLSLSKLRFDLDGMIDTLVRYKEKGAYTASKGGNAEEVVRGMLRKLDIGCETGDLGELVSNAPGEKRTMDFVIPSKAHPAVIAESSFLVTTASGQGDKSKTELAVRQLLHRHYPRARFFGFVDGIGWYARQGDLRRMVAAYDDVFTYRDDELARFQRALLGLLHAR